MEVLTTDGSTMLPDDVVLMSAGPHQALFGSGGHFPLQSSAPDRDKTAGDSHPIANVRRR